MSDPNSRCGIAVRSATIDDAAFIVDCNCRLAWETEHKSLDRPTVELGVRAALSDPAKARYFVAIVDGRPAGQVMHTWEWSDWRNGVFWWLQSVFVLPEHRGRGVFRRLFSHVHELAQADSRVVGMRLYVEQENTAAQAAYLKLGMADARYGVLEATFDRRGAP